MTMTAVTTMTLRCHHVSWNLRRGCGCGGGHDERRRRCRRRSEGVHRRIRCRYTTTRGMVDLEPMTRGV